MSEWFALGLRGAALGLAIAAPIGPIGMLCIRRTLERGFWMGLAGGLGTALADACYAAVSASGIAVVSTVLIRHALGLRVAGALFLIGLGARGLRRHAVPEARPAPAAAGLGATFATTFALTVANPATIASFAAAFAGFGLFDSSHHLAGAAALTVGVLLGSALWWVILSAAVSGARRMVSSRALVWIDRLSGLALIAFGAWMLVAAFVRAT